MEGAFLPVGCYPSSHSDSQPQDAELYDEVTKDQYRSILRPKGGQDDFIVDDDGQGNGYLDDDSEEEDERAESSEDEDDFEGEDEELRRGEQCRPCRPEMACS